MAATSRGVSLFVRGKESAKFRVPKFRLGVERGCPDFGPKEKWSDIFWILHFEKV